MHSYFQIHPTTVFRLCCAVVRVVTIKTIIYRDDDVFLLLDADELPAPEALLFLKVFDGWTEPVRLTMRWTVFGFFWLMSNQVGKKEVRPGKTEEILILYAACTIGMLQKG